MNAEIARQFRGIIDASPRRISARHTDAHDVVAPQRIDSDTRRERGIDAAAQAKNRTSEAAFVHIVARAQYQRGVGTRHF